MEQQYKKQFLKQESDNIEKLLEREECNQFYKSLNKNISELTKQINNIEFCKILDKIDFPDNSYKLFNL